MMNCYLMQEKGSFHYQIERLNQWKVLNCCTVSEETSLNEFLVELDLQHILKDRSPISIILIVGQT